MKKNNVKKLPCGCYVKYWKYTGPEYYIKCEDHQKIDRMIEDDYKKLPFKKKIGTYLLYSLFIGIFILSLYWFIFFIAGIIDIIF